MIPSPFYYISSPHFNENDPIIYVTVASDSGKPSDVIDSEKSEGAPLSRRNDEKADCIIKSKSLLK